MSEGLRKQMLWLSRWLAHLQGFTLVQIRFSLRQFGQHAGGVAVERVQAVDAKAR